MKSALDALKSQGWDINIYGTRVLTRAIDDEQFEAIDFLVQNGLRINREDIEYAEDKKKYDVARYLQNFM